MLPDLELPLSEYFKKDRAGCTRLDAFRLAMEGFSKQSGAACNSKLGIRVFQLEQWQATLPFPDLVTDPLPQELGTERAAVEQDRIDARTTPQECGKVPSDRTIRCIGEPPLFQGGLRPIGIGLSVALGEEPIEQYRKELRTRQLGATRSRDQAGTAPG